MQASTVARSIVFSAQPIAPEDVTSAAARAALTAGSVRARMVQHRAGPHFVDFRVGKRSASPRLRVIWNRVVDGRLQVTLEIDGLSADTRPSVHRLIARFIDALGVELGADPTERVPAGPEISGPSYDCRSVG